MSALKTENGSFPKHERPDKICINIVLNGFGLLLKAVFKLKFTQTVKNYFSAHDIIIIRKYTFHFRIYGGGCMKDFYIFVKSLEYIEHNLCSEITQKEIAAHCCCSVSALQKMWKYCTHQGIISYVKKRRLTLAAKELTDGAGVLEVAVKYGYSSNEAFTKAFRKYIGINPSEFAKSRRFTDLYPMLNKKYYNGGTFMGRTKFDLTELYGKIQDKKNTYIACFDIKGLDNINKELGRKVGDAVINACISRIDSALKDGMLAFRVGGDEFIAATGYTNISDAEGFTREVTEKNGEIIVCDGIEAEVSLHSGIMLYSSEAENFYEKFEKSLIRK